MNSDKNLLLDFNEICRLCLSKEGIMLPIFDNDSNEDDMSLSSRISICASIQVSQGDGLPTLVCNKCVHRLDSWYTFKEQCRSSDATLRQHAASHGKVLMVTKMTQTDSTSKNNDEFSFGYRLSETEIFRSTAKVTTEVCINNFCSGNSSDQTEGSAVGLGERMGGPDLEESRAVGDDPSGCLAASPPPRGDGDGSEDENGPTSEPELPPLPEEKRFPCAPLRDHEASHSGTKGFPCAGCPEAFCTTSQLRAHARTHSPEKPHACATCGKSFRKRSGARLHKATHSGAARLLCSVCGKCCGTRGALKSHLLVHAARRDHVCAVCGKSFARRSSLVTHARVHRPERPARCERCGAAFKRRDELRRHLRVHTGERPFACALCGRCFSDKWNLTQHVRLHTGDRPYVCAVCGQSFTYGATLRKHARWHDGDPAQASQA
ncbi:myeloid zinc finger 1-like isoform X1 [Bacillus rossius redtenbacheri]|uniref:myeloid zinc finger 1-like isoform X1 n=1 Tax=Bacillus rossius redtenbacheri TaxID=93214 RepID=UPI002FDE422B